MTEPKDRILHNPEKPKRPNRAVELVRNLLALLQGKNAPQQADTDDRSISADPEARPLVEAPKATVAVEKIGNETRITATAVNECGVTGERYVNDLFRLELLKFGQKELLENKKMLLLFMFDIRNLKKINDILGHSKANVVIKHFVSQVREKIIELTQATDTKFVLYRPQSGGDEVNVLFSGDLETLAAIDHALGQFITEILCEVEKIKRQGQPDEVITYTAGAEFGSFAINNVIPVDQQIYENEILLEMEGRFNKENANDFEKFAWLYELAQEVAERELAEKKFAQLLEEILFTDTIVMELVKKLDTTDRPPLTTRQNLQIHRVFKEIDDQIAERFASRRMTKLGVLYVMMISKRCEEVKLNLLANEPLKLIHKQFLGILTADQVGAQQAVMRDQIRQKDLPRDQKLDLVKRNF